jgi:hypothetical protein
MKKILASPPLFLVLAGLLLLAFFLPDLVGPVIGTAVSAAIILLAWLIYCQWCRESPSDREGGPDDSDDKPPA